MSCGYFDTEAEYTEEIAAVRAAIRRQLKIGAEHENDSGGSSRKMKDVDINDLKRYLKELQEQLCELKGEDTAVVFQSAW